MKPLLVQESVESVGKVAIGTAQDDLYDIGKNLVSIMMSGAGFEIYDHGTDVLPECFVEKVKKIGASIVAVSELLSTTMASILTVIISFEAADLHYEISILVGGAPSQLPLPNRLMQTDMPSMPARQSGA